MKQNKKEWFSGQVREYQDVMYGYAFCMLRNDSDAKDVMQDAIIKAFQKLEQLKNPDRFKPWIMSILRNCIYDLMRDRKEYEVLDHEWVMPDNNSISIEEKVDLYQAVQKLDFSYRTVIYLYYYDDRSVKEIARITGVNPATVRQRLSRARKILKELLKERN